MASSPLPNNATTSALETTQTGTVQEAIERRRLIDDLERRAEALQQSATMLHPSSGRSNFLRVTWRSSIPSCPALVSNFFFRLKDQIRNAIRRADKQEATGSSSQPAAKQ